MEVQSSEDPHVPHTGEADEPGMLPTIRSLPPITLRLPIDLRQALEAQDAAAGQSVNAYLTQRLSDEGDQVRVTVDADLRQWVTTLRREGEDLGVVMTSLLTELRDVLEDRSRDLVLLTIPQELQGWLARRAQRYRSRGRERVLLGLLRRAAQVPPQ